MTLSAAVGSQDGVFPEDIEPSINDALTQAQAALQAAQDPVTQAMAQQAVLGFGQVAQATQLANAMSTFHRRSLLLGMRYDFHDQAALKLEVERVHNRIADDYTNIYSLAVDFTF